MSVYTPHTEDEVKEMLSALKLASLEQLYEGVPEEFLLKKLDLPQGLSQAGAEKKVKELAAKNKVYNVIFRGAGAYSHYIPAAVRELSKRSEFLTAYTPYQAELSQGILQSIFEYQTMICELTGMDVSNASHYDGATAAAEAVLMCREREKNKLVVAPYVKPEVLSVISAYFDGEIIVAPQSDGLTDLDELSKLLDSQTAAFYMEQPAANGLIERVKEAAKTVHGAGAKLIVGCYPIALALLPSPGECGADIAVGEGQPLGMDIAFGGPYLGFMAAKTALVRKLPGRIAGETTDSSGKKCYVLTLQAREQHIRREKAGSNICSNQAHCALKAAMYMALLGAEGLNKTAKLCVNNAHYLLKGLESIGFKAKYEDEFFNEFVTVSKFDSSVVEEILDRHGILSGLPLNKKEMLWCATETTAGEDIDKTIKILREELC